MQGSSEELQQPCVRDKVSHLVGRHQLWSNLEMDGHHQVKMPKSCYMMRTPRNHSWGSKFGHPIIADGGEWWTAQHIGAPMTPSGVKGKGRAMNNYTYCQSIQQHCPTIFFFGILLLLILFLVEWS